MYVYRPKSLRMRIIYFASYSFILCNSDFIIVLVYFIGLKT